MPKKIALRNLKLYNRLVSNQDQALSLFKTIRKAVPTKSLAGVRDASGLAKNITGRSGKKILAGLKQQRKMSAFALRELRGDHLKLKAKWSPENLKQFRRIAKEFPGTPLSNKAAQATKNLVDRSINLRGKGVRFIRVRGKIVPIRGKK